MKNPLNSRISALVLSLAAGLVATASVAPRAHAFEPEPDGDPAAASAWYARDIRVFDREANLTYSSKLGAEKLPNYFQHVISYNDSQSIQLVLQQMAEVEKGIRTSADNFKAKCSGYQQKPEPKYTLLILYAPKGMTASDNEHVHFAIDRTESIDANAEDFIHANLASAANRSNPVGFFGAGCTDAKSAEGNPAVSKNQVADGDSPGEGFVKIVEGGSGYRHRATYAKWNDCGTRGVTAPAVITWVNSVYDKLADQCDHDEKQRISRNDLSKALGFDAATPPAPPALGAPAAPQVDKDGKVIQINSPFGKQQ